MVILDLELIYCVPFQSYKTAAQNSFEFKSAMSRLSIRTPAVHSFTRHVGTRDLRVTYYGDGNSVLVAMTTSGDK